MLNYLLLVLFAVMLSAGQLLFKKAAIAGNDGNLIQSLISGWMVAALLFYGSATILWVWILRSVPLSVAYPFAALGFVIVPLSAMLLFGETITWRYALGGLMIVVGIILAGTS